MTKDSSFNKLRRFDVSLSSALANRPVLANRYDRGAHIRRHLHRHLECEICYFPHDSGVFLYEQQEVPFQKGDVFLNGSNVYHHPVFEHEGNHGLAVIYFHPSFLAQLPVGWSKALSVIGPQGPGYQRLEGNYEAAKLVLQLIETFNSTSKGCNNFLSQGILLHLLSLFATQAHASTPYLPPSVTSKLDPVVEFIHHNFTEVISIRQLYALAGMSRSVFCEKFKSQYGTDATTYIKNMRLAHSKQLLISTEMNVSQVAMSSGYNTPSLFNRLFRKDIGLSPTEFRNTYRTKKDIS